MRNEPKNFLESVPDPTALTGNELAKSRSTRRRILDAARDILATQGYSRFSTLAVAERAGLTRPAMLYHFGSRLELVKATVHHLARQRIEVFEAALADISIEPGYKGQAVRAALVDTLWNQLQGPDFAAFTELVAAARTDSELRSITSPVLVAFDESRRAAAERVLPEGSYDPEDFQLSRDIVHYLLEGVLQQDSIAANRERRLAAIRHFLKMLVASTPGAEFLQAVTADWKANNPPA
ncbi:TetR/AcrR family transcriptional regulator [Sandaracinobacter neustonicus]|uniref:TetR/AcrR family transcriptional regulator n=1 Tax=Sandaracinobacter neustonicus TaxID=1715348 RepID=UPI001A9C2FD0|nr:TetR/AcrR family transcriptional regulator [Sandaracinobacter neustonicus]